MLLYGTINSANIYSMHSAFQNSFKFEVVAGTKLGRACIATGPIKSDEIICKMAGPLISLRDFFDKYEVNECTPLQIGGDKYIDLIEPYVCFNHSCRPNAGIRNDGILFALQEIKVGEEIMYDYSTTVDDPIWHMNCLCGASECRGIIADFQSVPHERKEFYKNRNAVTSHIKKIYY